MDEIRDATKLTSEERKTTQEMNEIRDTTKLMSEEKKTTQEMDEILPRCAASSRLSIPASSKKLSRLRNVFT